jgi:lipopolysaccharide biosynthesis protein
MTTEQMSQDLKTTTAESTCRLLAMYLPQFHPIPENDAWWGKGFTEWTNVTRSQPKFHGHYQPHVPKDLGYYDLRLPEVRSQQAELARNHGIAGFCYYHYWFNGKRLLERPLAEVLKSGEPDFPFCICWANENWTRRWDGHDQEMLIGQKYSPDDDHQHIRALLPLFADHRYVRVEGKPLFAVYRSSHLPDAARSTDIWREEALKAGIGELFLCRFETWDSMVSPDPRSMGFDAAVEFAPDWRRAGGQDFAGWKARVLASAGVLPKTYVENRFFDYREMMASMMRRETPRYPLFRGVTPGFDNSARRKTAAMIIRHSTPEAYRKWLRFAIEWTEQHHDSDKRLIFINAWNEWAEGNHLEPDMKGPSSFCVGFALENKM